MVGPQQRNVRVRHREEGWVSGFRYSRQFYEAETLPGDFPDDVVVIRVGPAEGRPGHSVGR